MPLEALSNELLVEIAEWVNETCDTQTLLDLALCSRRLNAVATPIMYQSFHSGHRDVLPVFLRTLLAKPELGLRVQSFSAPMHAHWDRRGYMSGYGNEDFMRAQAAVESIYHALPVDGGVQMWMARISTGNWHALAALAFFHMPNLRDIEISQYDVLDPYDGILDRGYLHSIPATLDFLADSKDHLNSLERIEILPYDPLYGFNFKSIWSFFRSNSVKTVTISCVVGADLDDQASRYETEEIDFKRSCCSGEPMIRFLRCFPQLKAFSYEHLEGPIDYVEFDAPRFGQAIAHLKPCLEYLHISNGGYDELVLNQPHLGTIGSLSGFRALEILEIDADTILGLYHGNAGDPDELSSGANARRKLYKLLPRCLEYLHLRNCSNSIVGQLWDVIDWKKKADASLSSSFIHNHIILVDMATLSALSNEILVDIADKAGSIDGTTTLHNLALCSRRLNSLATPSLYSSFPNKDVPKFLRTLIANAQLGFMVKHFSVNVASAEPLGNEYLQVFESAIEEIFNSDVALNWMNSLHQPKQEEFAAVTLFYLPNLIHLELQHCGSFSQYQPWSIHWALDLMANNQINSSGFYLQNLQIISATHRGLTGFHLKELFHFFKLNSVKEVRIQPASHDLCRGDFGYQFPTERLDIQDGLCSGDSLTNFLGYFPKLKSLIYHHDYNSMIEFNQYRLRLAIGRLKHCLEELSLTTGETLFETFTSGFGSMAEFGALRVLEVDASFLLGPHHSNAPIIDDNGQQSMPLRLYRQLPSRLENLRLLKCKSTILGQLWDLIDWKLGNSAQLKHVSVSYLYWNTGHDQSSGSRGDQRLLSLESMNMDLIEACRNAGMLLQFPPHQAELLDGL
ncbi:uncharacterized protein LY89DRAFT_730157 [Mollisia scopiformis]|uniref:Leucine-rich repeat domain-containing protein n=1 Tax=Mollisia scopiformis TaxID=149040 RepID=A0A194XNR7_MOLSC|nr:uncharacterized protein LY89DRAFT_730157 [Mollisia scopiformis]KUJ21377.1 hypothetical protein LY89DRAFT_730157 [Mollisia scopiformis]